VAAHLVLVSASRLARTLLDRVRVSVLEEALYKVADERLQLDRVVLSWYFWTSLRDPVPGSDRGSFWAPCESTTGVDSRAAFAPMDFHRVFLPVDFRQQTALFAPLNKVM
jgi:hypothetical protein